MKRFFLIFILFLPLWVYSQNVVNNFKIKYLILKDISRNREIPIKVYYPDKNDKYPVIFFSHGLGGDREGGKDWGEFWASNGYISIHIQHHGSDIEVLKQKSGGIKDRVEELFKHANTKNLIDRIRDSKFCVNYLSILNLQDNDLKGLLDTNRIGFSGHSFGALTTQCLAGQVFKLDDGKEISFYEEKIKAFIAFSPTVTKKIERNNFDKIFSPFLCLTGDKDEVKLIGARPEERRIPFDNMPKNDKYLVIFKDANHMTFSGQHHFINSDNKSDKFSDLIKKITLSFWDYYLKGKNEAYEYLVKYFKKEINGIGTFEMK